MPTAIEALKEFKAKREALDKELADNGKRLFSEASAEIFAAHPVLVSFAWTEYAPHWNDGEPCEFSAHTEDVYLKTSNESAVANTDGVDEDEDEEDEDGEEETFSRYDFEEGPYNNKTVKANLTPREAAGKAVIEFLENFDDDSLETMFGDGKVVVTKGGVEVEEYDHD